MQDTEHCLRVLGLGADATDQQIKDAYRDLVKVWHPDRFKSDERLYLKGEEKLRELNEAYEHLRQPREPRPNVSKAPRTRVRTNQEPSEWFPIPSEQRKPRTTAAALVAGLLIATSAIVGFLLAGAQRETVTPARETLGLERQPRQAPTVAGRQGGDTTHKAEPAAAAPTPAAPTTGALAVLSQPAGASVYFDDQNVGQTPLTLTAIAPGEHLIRLELANHRAWFSSVPIEAGSGEKVLAILEKQEGR